MPTLIPAAITYIAGALGASAFLKLMLYVVASAVIGEMTKEKEEKKPRNIEIQNNTCDTSVPLPLIYGRVKVGGNDVFRTVTVQVPDEDDYVTPYRSVLWIVQTLGEGECEGIDTDGRGDLVFIDGRRLQDWEAEHETAIDGDLISYNFHSGTLDQTYDTELYNATMNSEEHVAANCIWTDNMQGACYIVWKLAYKEGAFSSRPHLAVVLKGRKVHLPDGAFEWSDNPAAILYDYLKSPHYAVGLGDAGQLAVDEIDHNSYSDSYDFCERSDMGWKFNGAITHEDSIRDAIDRIKLYFRGNLVETDGMFHIRYKNLPDESVAMILTDDHILVDNKGRSRIALSTAGKLEEIDALQISFTNDSEDRYIDDYIVIGENEGNVKSFDLSGYNSRELAGKMGNYILETSKDPYNRVIEGFFRDDCFQLEKGDVVTLTSSDLGYNEQTLRVGSIERDSTGVVKLAFQLEHTDLYNDTYEPVIEGLYESVLPTSDVYSHTGLISGVDPDLIASEFRNFHDVFDNPHHDIDFRWRNYSGDGESTVVASSDSISGGHFWRVGNNSGDDRRHVIYWKSIPFDSSMLYRIRVRARRTAGTGTISVGIAGRNYDDTEFINIYGNDKYYAQHHIVVNEYDLDTSWEVLTGYFKGTGLTGDNTAHADPSDPAILHSDCRYFRPLLIINDGPHTSWNSWTGSDEGVIWTDSAYAPDETVLFTDIATDEYASGTIEIDEFMVEVIPDQIEAFNFANALITKVIPGDNAAPTGAGLYVGYDYMGYYSAGVWLAYIDNSGNFYCGDGANEYIQVQSGAVTLSTAQPNAITIKSGGNIKMEAATSDPAEIEFVGSSYSVSIKNYTDSGSSFGVFPNTDDVMIYYVGSQSYRFTDYRVYSSEQASFVTIEDSNNYCSFSTYIGGSETGCFVAIKEDDGVTPSIHMIKIQYDRTPSDIIEVQPIALLTREWSLGTQTYPWTYIHGLYYQPHTSADAVAPNNSVYYSSDQSKLVYKDSGGSVHDLY